MWRFYGTFTALAFAGCISGIVSASIQLTDEFGLISMLFYFDDNRVFNDQLASKHLHAPDMVGLLQTLSATNEFKAGEFFFLSIAKILVVHRLTIFVKLGRSDRAIKFINDLDKALVTIIATLSFVVLVASFAECHFYGEAARKSAFLNLKNCSVSDVVGEIRGTLDKGNVVTMVVHFTMGVTNLLTLIAILATAAGAHRGIRSTFTFDKLQVSAEVRNTRRRIVAFCVCAVVAYLLVTMCALPPFSRLTFGDGFCSNELLPFVSDIINDPAENCQFCQSCQPTIDLLLQFLSGCRLIEASILFLSGPFPVFVCLWSMTSESARKLLDSSSERAADANSRASRWFNFKAPTFFSQSVLPPAPTLLTPHVNLSFEFVKFLQPSVI